MEGRVIAVASDARHGFAKNVRDRIDLLAGFGVAGDSHCGASVQHRSRLVRTPDAPNLRQVHLLPAELFAELGAAGFAVAPGELGENVTTSGVALLALPRGTRLRLGGGEALVELTGLRNPCAQIDTHIGKGAMQAVLARDADGELVRKAGVMAIVIESGPVRPGDPIRLEHVPEVFEPLAPV